MEEFRSYLDELAGSGSGKLITNSSLSHAEIVLETMFKRAQREVLVYADTLDSPTYGSRYILSSVVDMLRKNPNVSMRIVTNGPSTSDQSWLKTLRSENLDRQVELRHLDTVPNNRQFGHFAVVDGESYRFEANRDKGGDGVAQFHSPERAHIVMLAFEALYRQAIPVSIDGQNFSVPLSISSLIIPDRRGSEGILIRSTSVLWDEIVTKLNDNWEVAYQLSPEKWEELIAGAFKRAGYDEVELTRRSGDHGRDVIAVKRGVGSVKIIGSVKAYKRGLLVPYDAVRSLAGVLAGERDASKGIITTTSDFPPRIANDPFIAPFLPTRLELMNGDQLQRWLSELRETK